MALCALAIACDAARDPSEQHVAKGWGIRHRAADSRLRSKEQASRSSLGIARDRPSAWHTPHLALPGFGGDSVWNRHVQADVEKALSFLRLISTTFWLLDAPTWTLRHGLDTAVGGRLLARVSRSLEAWNGRCKVTTGNPKHF